MQDEKVMELEKTFISVKGEDVEVGSIRVGGTVIVLSDGFLRQAWVDDEWYTEVERPELIIDALKRLNPKPDLFSFIQRIPEIKQKFSYHREMEGWAVLPVSTYDYWWKNQIKDKTRNLARKAEKKGLVIRRPEFDDAFIEGMVDIFNETPVRQGKPFWHYGKDFETVKRQFSRYLFRESLIGVYCGEELLGFIMLGYAGKFAVLGQIISKIEHRDKSINNAMIAEAVKVCEERGIPYLCYAYWDDRSLGQFKKNNGFERFDVPRYYVPLTAKGRLALWLNLHRGLKNMIPGRILNIMKDLRKRYYQK